MGSGSFVCGDGEQATCHNLQTYAKTRIVQHMKRIVWTGSSKEDVRDFPAAARREAGYQLDKLQRGELPDDWKPMPTIGPGVREIRIRDAAGAFRVIYVAHVADAVHVLHGFQKINQHDVRIARSRLSLVTR